MPSSSSAKLAAAMGLALATGGCFTPLYGEAAHPGISEDMRAIVVDPINPPGEGKTSPTGIAYGVDRVDRVGHYLRDDLIFDLNGTGATSTPKYRLHVSTTQGTVTPTIETQESLATAAITQITASYQLIPYAGGAAIVSGTAFSSKTQDIFVSRYANLRSARDSEIRVAKSLADEIELRIAAGLVDKQPH